MKHMNLRNTLNAAALIGATIVTTTALAAPAVPAARSVTLPQRITAAELKRMQMDLPGTFEILDLRPPSQYADFSLPGSINASIADVIANPAYLKHEVPLVIVDRDGSLAMAVGGILSQRTRRSIRVLYGGLEAYWNDSASLLPLVAPALVNSVKPAASVPVSARSAAPGEASVDSVKPASSVSATAGPAAPAPAARATATKKSAGC